VRTAQAEPRTLAPPARRVASVVANQSLGAYRLITAGDAGGPADPRPGQFYMLAAAERWGGSADERPYLPRAFSFARARPTGDGAELDFLLESIGPGTDRLASLQPGEGLALVGPLGVGFRTPERGQAVLVGGGIGAAPVVALDDELRAAGADPTVLLGFRSAAHAEGARLFGRSQMVTDDGSVGRQALVTDLLAKRLDEDAEAHVYACGPPPMLEAVRAMCSDRGVPAQLALESGMACGFGACFGCAIPTKEGYIRLCLEGPVLAADRLDSAL
jgi:dihydroorotate dehydrogenase electron transfer subunit